MPRPPEEKLAIEERRKKVASLWLAHLTQTEIARQLEVSQPTISLDIQAIRREYRADRTDILDREAAELDQMERDAALQFVHTKAREWMSERRAIKERRAKLLGLDAPQKLEQSGPGGGPLVLKWEDGSSEPDETA